MEQNGWKGVWHNQHGSTVTIIDDDGGVILSTFTTALEDNDFFGKPYRSTEWLGAT